MVDKNDALAREIDEELRRDQIEKLWQQYGLYALIFAVFIVAGVGGTKWLEARRKAASEAAGAAYNAAISNLDAGKADDAEKALRGITASGAAGYAQLAQLRLAGAAMKAGKTAEALKSFEDLGKDTSADGLLRGFARLQAASLRMGEADFTEMQNRLNDLMAADSPWRANARELLGVAAMKAGKMDEARKAFEQLLGERNAPQSVTERVRTLMSSIVAAELAVAAPAAAPAAATPAAGGDAKTTTGAGQPAKQK